MRLRQVIKGLKRGHIRVERNAFLPHQLDQLAIIPRALLFGKDVDTVRRALQGWQCLA